LDSMKQNKSIGKIKEPFPGTLKNQRIMNI